MLAAIALVFTLGDALLPLFTMAPPSGDSSQVPHLSTTLLGSAVLVLGSLLFLWAAGLTRRLHDRDGLVGQAYVAIGLVFAAFAQLQQALFPSVHPIEASAGDVLWLAFSIALLVGIEAEARDTLKTLHETNESLGRLRDAEVDRAALEERARLSRELHDGLAQDLWLAKLKAGRLAAIPDQGPEATILCDELVSAIDSGLADARQAVMALRLNVDSPEAPVSELLRRYVEDFQDRFGLRAELECDDALPRLRPRVEAELLRIAQEALSNVAQHADATLVQVQLLLAGDQLTLLVRDNGRGFDLTAVGDDDFGLASMRERAAIIGGDLTVESRPSDGTCIKVQTPLMTSVGVGVASW
jgi:signal transduction histidine kinase